MSTRRGRNPLSTIAVVLLTAFACWRAYTFVTLRPFRECAEAIHSGQPASDVEAAFTAAGFVPDADDAHTWQLDYGVMHHAHCHIGVDRAGHVSSMSMVAGPRLEGCDQAAALREHPGLCTLLDIVTP